MEKCIKFLTIGALLAALCVPAGITASANSAQMNWSGSSSSGVAVLDGECPVVVEKELLTFDIPEFPSNYYGEYGDDFDKYQSKVTARYEFYNPADYDVDMTLAFPFGVMPDYAYGLDDTKKYSLTVDGEVITSAVRHTYYPNYYFNSAAELPKLSDGFKEDNFYSPELTVYKYMFRIGNINYDGDNTVHGELSINKNSGRRVVGTANGYSSEQNGFSINWSLYGGDKIYVYSVGAPLTEAEQHWEFYYYTNGNRKRYVSGGVTLAEQTELTFKELALVYYDPDGAVSESDWYNAVVDSMNRDNYGGFVGLNSLEVGRYLMRWYVYDMHLAAGARAVNEVTAPLYPDINARYTPSVYTYNYLLSPAKSWASFGTLEIKINTPYYIVGANNKNFAKTEYGYTLIRDGLPDGELEFELCASETPEGGYFISGINGITIAGYVFISLNIACVLVPLITLTVLEVKRRKKKKGC